MQTYNLGDIATLKCTCLDVNGALVTPTTLTFTMLLPDGTTVAYTYGTGSSIVRDSEGVYHVAVPISLPGFYQYQFKPSGAGALSVPMDWAYGINTAIELTTLAHVKNWAEVDGTNDDTVIQMCLVGLSRYIYNRTGRATLGPHVNLSQVYNGSGSNILALRDWPVVSLTSVYVNGVSMALSSGYGIGGVAVTGSERKFIAILAAMSGASNYPILSSSPGIFHRGTNNIQVNYQAGYGYVPEDLEQAVCEGVSLNYKRKAWQDMKSESQSTTGSSGTTTHQDWHLSPGVERVIQYYSRKTY